MTDPIVAAARKWIGTPYHHQASVQGVGCDCLGLIRGLWREQIGEEPEHAPAYTRDWTEARREETLRDAALRHFEPAGSIPHPGDVLIFRMRQKSCAKHVGILSTQTTFIHAAEHTGVVEIPFVSWWQRRVTTRVRFPLINRETP